MLPFFSSPGSIPIWILGFLLLFFIVLTRLSYRSSDTAGRKGYRIPLLFRVGAFLAVVVLVGNLGISWKTTLVRKPLVRVFFDNSVSSAYHQSVSSESLVNGYQEIAAAIRDTLDSAPNDGHVEFYSFGSEIKRLDPKEMAISFDEPTTDLSAVLGVTDQVPPDQFLAAMVLVTDGQVTRGVDPEELAGELDVPLVIVGIGNLTPMVDVHIERVEVPTVGLKGDMVNAEAFVSSIGEIHERVHVTLSRGNRLLGSKMIRLLGQSSMQTVGFRFLLDDPGSHTYRVQVAALKDEINIANNRSSFEITTLRDRFRVALITGAPSENTSFIKRVLRSEGRFETDHFVDHGKGWSPPIARFWRTNYDLVVLDNVPTPGMPERWAVDLEDKLERYPSAVAYIPGPNVAARKALSFFPLLGIQQSRAIVDQDRNYPVAIPEESRRHPIFSMEAAIPQKSLSTMSFPPLRPFLLAEPMAGQNAALAYLEVPDGVPLFLAGSVNLAGPEKPVRVASITSKDLWQFDFRLAWTDYAGFVSQWWKRTFDWLVMSTGTGDIYFRLNRRTFQQGETIYATGTILDLGGMRTEDARVSMIVRDESGETKSFPLVYSPSSGRWEGNFLAGKPGAYHWVVRAEHRETPKGEQTGTFRVEESQIELNRVFLNQELLTRLADLTGGDFKSWDDRLTVNRSLDLESRGLTVPRTVLLSHWLPLCILVLAFVTGEWITRRIFGLQ